MIYSQLLHQQLTHHQFFAKKGTADSFRIEFGTGANNVQTVFNLTTKTFSASAAAGWFASLSTSYIEYPNGWVRVILKGTTSGSVSGDPNYAVYGISSGYVYFWGGQVEVGSFVTSLIPTHGSTVTRAADIAKITGTNFSDFYNQTEGTAFINALMPNSKGATGTFQHMRLKLPQIQITTLDFLETILEHIIISTHLM